MRKYHNKYPITGKRKEFLIRINEEKTKYRKIKKIQINGNKEIPKMGKEGNVQINDYGKYNI